jgi:hypothetical protein
MASYQERPQASPRRRRRIAAVMGLETASLVVASLLHLSGFAPGHARPFTATGAAMLFVNSGPAITRATGFMVCTPRAVR